MRETENFSMNSRHVEPDKALGRVEEVGGEALDELGLADAGAADEDEAHGLALGLQAHAGALYGRADGVYGLVLAHDVLAQAVAELAEALVLVLGDGARGYLGPELDDAREVLARERGLVRLELVYLVGELHDGRAYDGQALVVLLLRVGQQDLALAVEVVYLLLRRVYAREALVLEVDVRAGLVYEVYGLVGQVAVGDIPLAEQHGLAAHLGRYPDLVALLVVVGDALEYLDGVLDARLGHGDGLEAALERGVLLDVLAVLGEGGRADDLYLAAGEGGLEDIGGVHAALGVARADDVVHLVYDEDDVAGLAYLLDEPLHAALELAAELRAGHEGGEVEEVDLLVAQLVGHVAAGDALGKALGDGRLADAGLADEAGVVLLAAVEYLYDALELLLAAYHGVELALARALGEVDAVVVQELALGPLRRGALRRGAALALPWLGRSARAGWGRPGAAGRPSGP